MRHVVLGVLTGVWAVTAGASPSEFWAQATDVRGDVTVTACPSAEAAPLQRGDVLPEGAVVRTGVGARATLLLASGGLLVVPADREQVVAPQPGSDPPGLAEVARNLHRTVLARRDEGPLLKHVGGLRDGSDNLARTPRRTRVRPGPVRLAWHAAPGVESYVVRLLGPTGSVLEREVAATELAVPAGLLVQGAGYVWQVRDAASPEALVPLGAATFAVVDEMTLASLQSQEEALDAAGQRTDPGDTSVLYLRAQLLRDAELYLEALAVLDALAAAAPGDAAVASEVRELRAFLGLPGAGVEER